MVRQFGKRLETTCAYASGGIFIFIFTLNFVEVVQRYFRGESIIWASDLIGLLFVWMVMFGAAAAYPQGEHLAVTFIKDGFPPTLRRVVDVITRLLFGFMLAVLIKEGLVISQVRMSIDLVQLGWPSGIMFYSVPFCATIMMFFLLISLWDRVKQ